MSTINLLPDDYLRKQWQSRANMICVALFLVVMAGVGTASLVSDRSTRHTQEVLNRVDADYAEAAKLLTQMRQLEVTKREMISKAKATGALLERVPRSYLLAILARALPEGASLVKVELKAGTAKRQQAAPAKETSKFEAAKKKQEKAADSSEPQVPPMLVEVTGLAATDVQVAGFIANLNSNPLLASVDLDYSQDKTLNDRKSSDAKIRVREFRVTIELRPNVDVMDLPGDKSDSPATKGLQSPSRTAVGAPNTPSGTGPAGGAES